MAFKGVKAALRTRASRVRGEAGGTDGRAQPDVESFERDEFAESAGMAPGVSEGCARASVSVHERRRWRIEKATPVANRVRHRRMTQMG